MIFLSTDIPQLTKMIYFLTHNVIQVLARTEKYPFQNGRLF